VRLLQRLGYGRRLINERMLALEKTSFTREDKVEESRSLSFGDLEGLLGVIQEEHPFLLLTQEDKKEAVLALCQSSCTSRLQNIFKTGTSL